MIALLLELLERPSTSGQLARLMDNCESCVWTVTLNQRKLSITLNRDNKIPNRSPKEVFEITKASICQSWLFFILLTIYIFTLITIKS